MRQIHANTLMGIEKHAIMFVETRLEDHVEQRSGQQLLFELDSL